MTTRLIGTYVFRRHLAASVMASTRVGRSVTSPADLNQKEPIMTTATYTDLDLSAIGALLDRLDPQPTVCCVGGCIHHRAHHTSRFDDVGDGLV